MKQEYTYSCDGGGLLIGNEIEFCDKDIIADGCRIIPIIEIQRIITE